MNKSLLTKTLFLLLIASCITSTYPMQKSKLEQWVYDHPSLSTFIATIIPAIAIPTILTYAPPSKRFDDISSNHKLLMGLVGGFGSGFLMYNEPELSLACFKGGTIGLGIGAIVTIARLGIKKIFQSNK